MKSILCYGDSNTWGFVPGSYAVRERYDRQTRWTGRLQELLGSTDFYVIEEGLNSRTTNLDYHVKRPGYRGTEFLEPILYTHAPLDLVVILLGINDFKSEFENRTSEEIAQGNKELIEIIRSTNYGPKMKEPPAILIVSSPLPVETTSNDTKEMFAGARERAQTLARDLESVVKQYEKNVFFLDASPHVELSPIDGIHFDRIAHENFAILLNKTIRNLFPST